MNKLIIAILILLPILSHATDYSSWTIQDWAVAYYRSQKEVHRLTVELHKAQESRLYWMQNYTSLFNQIENHLHPLITDLVNENHRLNQLLETQYHPGDMFFSVQAGVGTSITLGASFQIFFHNQWYGFVQGTGLYGRYWDDWEQPPYLSASAGIGWIWGR
jgi:hypothetical protein